MQLLIVIAIVVAVLYIVFRRQTGMSDDREDAQPLLSPPRTTRPLNETRKTTTLEDQTEPFELAYSMPIESEQWPDIEVQGLSGTYLVSSAHQTCTCADFQSRRARDLGTMGRLCKHLLRELNSRGCFAQASQWHQAIAADGHGGPISAWLLRRTSSPVVLITLSNNKEWINVYANTKRKGEKISNASGRIAAFGWSVCDKRWSYGDGPPGARELRSLLSVIESTR